MKVLYTICLLLSAICLCACSGGGATGDPCEGVDCSGHGTCESQGGEPHCNCEWGYETSADGKDCIPEGGDACTGIDCSGHGDCRMDDNQQPYCECDANYWPAETGLECIDKDSCGGGCGDIGCCGTRCCRALPSNSDHFGELQQTGGTKSASGSFDTDTNCTAGSSLGDCEPVLISGQTDVCVCRVDTLTISSLTVTGPRLLAVIAWTSVSINGTLDISGRGDPGPGAETQTPANSWLGGAGGSLGTTGGGSPAARGNERLVPLFGGQNGQDGCDDRAGGGGGGGIQITAGESITVSGTILALGGGGQGGAAGERPAKCSGAGGAGSGGAILLESKTVTVSGAIWAHGGSGGGGGNSLGSSGGDGQDASASMTAAAGGAGRDGATCALYGTIYGGDGGDGAVGDNPGQDGEDPAENQCPAPPFPYVAGGGGGGGTGRIRINTLDQCSCTGTLSPTYSFGVLQGG